MFAADAAGRDVSNNVDSLNSGIDGFDPIPFAVGQAVRNENAIAPGTEIIAGDEFVFDVDVSNPEILRYVQTGLAEGQLGFVVTSMHGTGVMGAGDPFVNLATSNHFAIAAPVFEVAVTVNDGFAGDFDMDGVLTALDIDRLAHQVRNGGFDSQFDLNGDSTLNADDHRKWVEQAFGTFYGDSNLDGEFNSSDFVAVFTASEYEDSIPSNSTWATGDWNGDGDFDTKDFVLAFQSRGYEQGPKSAFAVPEPSATALLAVAGALLIATSYRRDSRSLTPDCFIG